jgi:hypothetical protein
MVGHDGGFARLGLVGAQICCIYGAKGRISYMLRGVRCLFWWVFLVVIEVTSLFSDAWHESGGGVG